jgi:hypothetical protein
MRGCERSDDGSQAALGKSVGGQVEDGERRTAGAGGGFEDRENDESSERIIKRAAAEAKVSAVRESRRRKELGEAVNDGWS